MRHMRTVAIGARGPGARVSPQGIGKDANRSTRRPDVFDFAGRDPVVDRPAADADRFAGLHDRKCLSVHKVLGSGVMRGALSRYDALGNQLPATCTQLLKMLYRAYWEKPLAVVNA